MVFIVASKLVAQTLPVSARNILDSKYPDWFVILYGSEYTNGGSPTKNIYPALFKCNLNKDSIPDYAIAFTAKGMQYYSAFVSNGKEYLFFILEDLSAAKDIDGLVGMTVHKKGEPITDYEVDADQRVFETDAISLVPFSGCCATTHYYDAESKTFKWFTSGD